MKEKKSVIYLFILMFGSVLILLATTEKIHTSMTLPSTRIDYRIDDQSGFNYQGVFDKQVMIQFASQMFDRPNVWGQNQMASNISQEDVKASIVDENYSNQNIYEGFKSYSQLIDYLQNFEYHIENTDQYGQLIDAVFNLDIRNGFTMSDLQQHETMLQDVVFIGSYDTYSIDVENDYKKILKSKVFYNSKYDYRITVAEVSAEEDYLLVDKNADETIEYAYTYVESQLVEIKAIDKNDLESILYTTFLGLGEEETKVYFEYKENNMMIARQIN